MLIQLPFLWAFYKVLSVTIEMRNAPWLWVGDLSQPEHYAIRFLPLIMIASSFWMQKMTPMAGGDPSQQKVMQFMPLMWGFFFWSASSGLVLYWLSSNTVQIAQQWFFNKTAPPAPAAAAPEKKADLIKGRQEADLTPKYSVQETGPRIEEFLHQMIADAGFELISRLSPATPAIRNSRTPICVVKFGGGDVDLLLANRAELLLALELVTQEICACTPTIIRASLSTPTNTGRCASRNCALSALAAADKVKRTGTISASIPMNSRERRVIHIALRNEGEVRSESAGAGPQRGVVIYPAGMAVDPRSSTASPAALWRRGRGRRPAGRPSGVSRRGRACRPR